MQTHAIPHNAVVLVGDGRKALFLRNLGSEKHPRLVVERLMEHADPPTREWGTDRPGRTAVGIGGSRSALEETDWHRVEEERFVHSITALLSKAAHAENGLQIVIILPPKALGEFRAGMDATLERHVVAQIHGDLTAHTLEDITKHFTVEAS